MCDAEDLDKATASPMDSLFGLHFHAYDPQAIKAEEHARTLVVTDIPFFITDALLRDTFSRYGNITRCHTRLSKLYFISLCHRCGRPNCNPDQCGSSSRPSHPSRPWQSNDKLRALYNKHLPPSHPAKRNNRFARPDNNNDGDCYISASRRRSNSRLNNRQQSHSRSQHELDHYVDGMDVAYPAPPTVLTDWKSIGAALEKVVAELALLTTQFSTMNNRITKLESAMAARALVPGPFINKPPSYIPFSMQGWDDSVNYTNNNILVDINSPPLQSTSGFTPIPHFAPIPPSNVAPFSPIDMEQRLSSFSDTVATLAGSIKEGIQQNNLILARQSSQANH
ncbi:hypothetical protein RIR_jg9103.t2 [Rhizophagus irregularis DAOM 181602=DAOM 197198]|nr:hypothetical protein RIR_jg9103.t2 [Rhizophagus irregularis DAOM 181602=DAOM 197198]